MMTLTNEITLSQNEVKRINQRYLEARGDAVSRLAAMSVMGSTIEELERENASLHAELAALKPDWNIAPNDVAHLIESYYVNFSLQPITKIVRIKERRPEET